MPGRVRLFSLVVLAAVAGGLPVASTSAATVQAATTVAPVPTVGALYTPTLLGLLPALGLPHYCTASVIHSPSHDLILTAAHCVTGPGLLIEFAPGYHDGQTPYGVWDVTTAYVPPGWLNGQNPQDDFAILRLAKQVRGGHLVGVEDVVGANLLGTAPAAGRTVFVAGYVSGSNDKPIGCTATVYYTGGYPSFDCGGFAGGTSGSPWLVTTGTTRTVTGVIGGLHQGGCTPSTSYSSAFGTDVVATYTRAVEHAAPDFVPPAGSDGC